MIEELILTALEEKKLLMIDLMEIHSKIDDEIKEIGVPMVSPPPPSYPHHQNIPKQIRKAQAFLNELNLIKESLLDQKNKLFQATLLMYQEEIDSITTDNVNESIPLPQWIHEMFEVKTNDDSELNNLKLLSTEASTSFTSTAISHLDAAIDQLDPFHCQSLSGSLNRLETAHEILKGRLELFKAEYEVLWSDLKVLANKLFPFDPEELNFPEYNNLVIDFLNNENEHQDIDKNNCFKSKPIKRSFLKKVLIDWRRIEKERSESISGSILLIGRLWNLIGTPENERFHLNINEISLANMKLLSNERHRLINFQQQKFKELYDLQVIELKKLMTMLRWTEAKQENILSSSIAYTADGLQFLSRQLAALQPRLELSLDLIKLISTRYALISKMKEFEKSASDPARLFRSSFQLLQEEKFRKTAQPSLLNSEAQIRAKLLEYKNKFDEEFVYYGDDVSIEIESVNNNNGEYLSILENEISNRFMSSGIFGFDQIKQRKERERQSFAFTSTPTSATTTDTPRYGCNNNNISTNNHRRIPSSNVLPQRRKLDK